MQFHPEYSTGQFELSVPHGAGIALADTNLVVRHTIRAVGRTHGLGGLVRAGRVRRARRQRRSPAPQPVEPAGSQHVPRRRWARGDDAGGRGLHRRRPRVAARRSSGSRARRSRATCGSSRIAGRVRGRAGGGRTGRPALRFVTRHGREPSRRRRTWRSSRSTGRPTPTWPSARSSPPGSTGSNATCRLPEPVTAIRRRSPRPSAASVKDHAAAVVARRRDRRARALDRAARGDGRHAVRLVRRDAQGRARGVRRDGRR